MYLQANSEENFSEEHQKLLKRLWARTTEDVVTGCYLFSATNARGHGQLSYKLRTYGVHRLSAMIFYGLDLDDKTQQANHTCPNRNCWNPDHIYVGTQSDNVKDAVRDGTYVSTQGNKTHCIRNHPLEGDNVIMRKDGGRDCRACQRLRMEKFQFLKYGRLPKTNNDDTGER
jgi:hypothetical protein